MPVRFNCHRCGALLSVGRRKIGAEIECPKCAAGVVVPSEDAITGEKVAPRASKDDAPGGDDPPEAAEATPTGEQGVGGAAAASASSTAASATRPAAAAGPTPVAKATAAAAQPVARPSAEAIAASALLDREETAGLIPEFIVYDELPVTDYSDIDTILTAPATAAAVRSGQVAAVATATPAGPLPVGTVVASPAGSASTRAGTAARGVVVPSHQMLLSKGLIVAALAIAVGLIGVAFALGFYLGRGQAEANPKVVPTVRLTDNVSIDGRLVYQSGPGKVVGDQGAVVLFLPEGAYPASVLPAEHFRPQELAGPGARDAIDKIKEAGCGYGRTDSDGQFVLSVPKPGRYHRLFISHLCQRSPRENIDVALRSLLAKYFDDPDALLGNLKYFHEVATIDAGFVSVPSHNFGASGQ